MKIAKIYITGQIGNSFNDDGSIAVKGVELQDVVSQVTENADAEGYEVIINSLGGSIRVGKLIAKYVKSLPSCTTIADVECASMGTEIHLAVAKENRKIIAGTKYSIHNPLMANVSGNASELIEMADMIKENEKDMAKMYVSATGLSKDAITGLMNQETSLTPEQCVTMGFASEILPAPKLNAVAFFDKQTNNNSIMKSVKEIVDAAFASFKKEFKIADAAPATPPAVAATGVDYTTSQGVLHLDTPEIGSVATLDGSPAPAGDYTAEDGTVITIDAESKVGEIATAATEETEMASLKSENEALKTQIETMSADFTKTLETEINALKAQIGSSFIPREGQAKFAKQKPAEKSTAELAKERKESYKKSAR